MTANKHWVFLFFKGILPDLVYIIPFIVFYYFDFIDFEFFLTAIIIIFLLVFVPLFYVHYNYYIINKNTIIKSLFIKDKNKFFDFENLKTVFIFKPRYFDNTGYRYIPFDNYFYVELVFADGEKIKITCLLDDKIDEKLKERFKTVEFIREDNTFSNFPNW